MATDPSAKSSSKRLGTILLEEGVITEGQLHEALAKKSEEGGFLGKTLVEMGFLQESVLITFLVKQCKIPHISLMDYELSKELIEVVPKEICLEYHLLPIDKLGRILTVAMVDPLNIEALERVREHCPELRIKPILCSWQHYEHVVRRVFPSESPPPEELPVDDFGLKLPAKASGTKQEVEADSVVLVEAVAAEPEIPEVQPAPRAAPPPAVDSVRSVAANLGTGRRGAAEAVTSEDFVAVIEDHVRSAIEQVVAGLIARIGQLVAESPDGTIPISSMELVKTIRSSIDDAMDEAVGLLLYQTQQALNRSRADASDLSAQDLTDLLRVSIRQALQDVSSALLRKTARAVLQDDPL